MSILIVRNDIEENSTGRALTGVDSAMTFELYMYNNRAFNLSANHVWSKYILMDEETQYIGTFNTIERVLEAKKELKPMVLTHEEWLSNQREDWKTHPRYQYW